jgi:hypothetical protein
MAISGTPDFQNYCVIFVVHNNAVITRAVESESEGIFRWSRSRKEFLGGVGVGRNF